MVSCAVVTLNCNKQLQDADSIREILSKIEEEDDDGHTFLVFCLQEMMPILDASMGWSEDYEEPFKNAVKTRTFIGKSIVGATCILAFAADCPSIAAVHNDYVAFGMMWSSLKGAALLSVTLKYQMGKITFVCPHLSANEGYKAQRDRDFNFMVDELDLSNIEGQIVIAGDLNYRTADGTLSTDELQESMNSETVGKEFVESPIDFQPTYKFYSGTNTYQDGKRKPSYCDRILYRPLQDLEVWDYNSVMCKKLKSDHKPVFLSLNTPTKTRRSDAGWKTDEDQSVVFTTAEVMLGQSILRSPPSVEEYFAPPPPPVPLREDRVSFGRLVNPVTDGVIGTVLYAITTKRGQLMTGALGLILALTLL